MGVKWAGQTSNDLYYCLRQAEACCTDGVSAPNHYIHLKAANTHIPPTWDVDTPHCILRFGPTCSQVHPDDALNKQ